jgi:hypothetical protein
MTDHLRRNAYLVDALGSSMRSGDHGLKTVPGLLRRVLAEESWREFVTQRGTHVRHERFEDFVQAAPLKGLGATIQLIDRIVGTDDPELLALLYQAKKIGQGARTDLTLPCDSQGSYDGGTDYVAVRLAQQAPEEFAAVQRGEKSIHAAAVAAGIRRPRIPVRLDDPASAVRSLKSNSTPEFWAELRRLIAEDA